MCISRNYKTPRYHEDIKQYLSIVPCEIWLDFTNLWTLGRKNCVSKWASAYRTLNPTFCGLLVSWLPCKGYSQTNWNGISPMNNNMISSLVYCMVRPEYCLKHLLLALFLPNRAQNSVSNPSYNWIQALHRKMCIHKTNKRQKRHSPSIINASH